MTQFFRLALSLILSTAIVLQTEPVYTFVSPVPPPVTEVSKPLEIAKDKTAILYNADDKLVKVGESYKQKMKKGTAITKRTTVYDPETGDILSQKTKQKFEKSGFFNSTAGKIIGAIGLAVLTVVTAGIGAAMLGGAFFGTTIVGTLTVGGLIGAAVGSFIGTTALGLLQGQSIGDALKAGLISAAAVIVTAGIAKILTSGPVQGFLNQIGKGLADGVSKFATKAAESLVGGGVGETFGAKVLFLAATRIGSDEFATTFGKKLGAFGTAAILTFAVSAAGAFVNGGNLFSIETLTSLGLQAASRGGLAEAFKNETGLGAQFAQQVAGNGLNGVDFTPVAKQFGNFFNNVGESLGLFSPATPQGLKAGSFSKALENLGIGKPQRVFFDEQTNEILGAEFYVGGKTIFVGLNETDLQKVFNSDLVNAQMQKLNASFPIGYLKEKSAAETKIPSDEENLLAHRNQQYRQEQGITEPNLLIYLMSGADGAKQQLASIFNVEASRPTDALNVTDIFEGSPEYFQAWSGMGKLGVSFKDIDFAARNNVNGLLGLLGLPPMNSNYHPYDVNTVVSGDFDMINGRVVRLTPDQFRRVIDFGSAEVYYNSAGQSDAIANGIATKYRPGDFVTLGGYSASGSQSVETARLLGAQGITVDLLIIADARAGSLDIPANVRRVEYFFQESQATVSDKLLNKVLLKPDEISTRSPSTIVNAHLIDATHLTIDENTEFTRIAGAALQSSTESHLTQFYIGSYIADYLSYYVGYIRNGLGNE